MGNFGTNDLQRASIEKRTLALADQFVHDNTLTLTNSMDFYTLASLVRNLDDVEVEITLLSLYRMDLDLNTSSEILPILSRFEELTLDDCDGTHLDAVISGILCESSIQRLRVFSQILDDRIYTALEAGLTNSRLIDLSLTIDMPKEATEHLCAGINQSCLKTLVFDQCEIYFDAVEVLCDCFRENKCLEVLKLEHCGLRDDEVASLLRAVKDHPTLLDLSVRMNHMYEEGIEAAMELLQCTPRLQQLDLAQQNPGVLNLEKLAHALHGNRTLIHLNLEENFLKDAHIAALTETLSTNTTLRKINLRNCELKDAGLLLLAACLGDFPSLTHLGLKENNFRVQLNHQQLMESLRHNHILQVLELDDENWIPEHLKFHLFLNQAGRKFLSQETIPLSFWPFILERVKRLFDSEKEYHFGESDIIFELLQGPALLER